jgi:hypothetical protein
MDFSAMKAETRKTEKTSVDKGKSESDGQNVKLLGGFFLAQAHCDSNDVFAVRLDLP